MVATDVASRGIGMIDCSPALPLSHPAVSCVKCPEMPNCFVLCMCASCKHCFLVQAHHDFLAREKEALEYPCNVACTMSFPLCKYPRVPLRIWKLDGSLQAACPRICHDHDCATIWTRMLCDCSSRREHCRQKCHRKGLHTFTTGTALRRLVLAW